MINDKYRVNKSMYDNMSPFKRNNMLKEMLENNHVIVFPNEEDYADGIP
jgi:hypothetical protein